MRNFNQNRDTIDLSEYLPDCLKHVREFDAIMRAEAPGIASLWQACEDCMNDQFITETTASGIERRERMLGITPFAADTLNDRRFRLLTRYNENRKYTRRGLEALLSALCGEDGFELTIQTSKFSIGIKVALTAKRQMSSITELLERVLPYNMVFTVELLCNTWEKARAFTWGALSELTWERFKEEVLPNGAVHKEL